MAYNLSGAPYPSGNHAHGGTRDTPLSSSLSSTALVAITIVGIATPAATHHPIGWAGLARLVGHPGGPAGPAGPEDMERAQRGRLDATYSRHTHTRTHTHTPDARSLIQPRLQIPRCCRCAPELRAVSAACARSPLLHLCAASALCMAPALPPSEVAGGRLARPAHVRARERAWLALAARQRRRRWGGGCPLAPIPCPPL